MSKRESLEELSKVSGGTVAPAGVVHDLGATQRTCLFSVEPAGDTALAEDVATLEQHGCVIVVMTDRTCGSRTRQLLFVRTHSQLLQHQIRNHFFLQCIEECSFQFNYRNEKEAHRW